MAGSSRRRALRAGSFQTRRKQLLASATPWTTCWRCGKTLAAHEPHRNGRAPWWEVDHIVSGDPQSPLRLAASTCNRKAGGAEGNALQRQRQEPRSPNA